MEIPEVIQALQCWNRRIRRHIMKTSSNGNIFRITSPLYGEFIGHRWIPLTKASDFKRSSSTGHVIFSYLETHIRDAGWVSRPCNLKDLNQDWLSQSKFNNPPKTALTVSDLSSKIAVKPHCFGACSRYARAIEHCAIGWERDLVWLDWPNWWLSACVPTFKITFNPTPNTLELTGNCGIKRYIEIHWRTSSLILEFRYVMPNVCPSLMGKIKTDAWHSFCVFILHEKP